jgi:hypothetical protein
MALRLFSRGKLRGRGWSRSPRIQTASTSPPAEYEWHCFISYTTREEEVRELKPLLDRYLAGLRMRGVEVCPVFYDGWYLHQDRYARPELEAKLSEGIERSAFTVAFLSPGYVRSEWCCYEWRTTEEEHQQREFPAPDCSILPVLWKRPLWDRCVREEGACGEEVLSRRMLDISSCLREPPERSPEKWAFAVGVLTKETLLFLERWYPEAGWTRSE